MSSIVLIVFHAPPSNCLNKPLLTMEQAFESKGEKVSIFCNLPQDIFLYVEKWNHSNRKAASLVLFCTAQHHKTGGLSMGSVMLLPGNALGRGGTHWVPLSKHMLSTYLVPGFWPKRWLTQTIPLRGFCSLRDKGMSKYQNATLNWTVYI